MHSCRVFNVSGKFIRGEFSKTEVLLYKRSWVNLSVTSRREISRRDVKKITCLPRRDVNHHVATSVFEASVTSRREISRRDVILMLLCHVATWIFMSRRQIVRLSVTSRRGILTSRRHLVTHSVTSRREPSRRDVI